MNKEHKEAALAISKIVSKLGVGEIESNHNRFYGIICDTLVDAKYRETKNLIKKGLDSGAYSMILKKNGDRFAEAKRAAMNLVNTEFLAEAHAREIVAILLIALDSSQKNVTAVEKWVDELGVKTQTATVSNTEPASTITVTDVEDPILKRAYIFLSDGNFLSAAQYAEKALDKKPESSKAYLAALLAELKLRNVSDLAKQNTPDFADNYNFKKACQYASSADRKELEEYAKKNVYARATHFMNLAKTEAEFKNAAALFNVHPSYKDCSQKREKCLVDAENARKEARYQEALRLPVDQQVSAFKALSGYKDSASKALQAANTLKAQRERQQQEEQLAAERRQAEQALVAERLRKHKNAKTITTAVMILISIGSILLDMWFTDTLKDSSGSFRWIWLPLIAAFICITMTAVLGVLVSGDKISVWTLLVFAIPGSLWALVRGVVVVLAMFGAAQGWAFLGAIFTCIFLFLLNIAGWGIGACVCFLHFSENC